MSSHVEEKVSMLSGISSYKDTNPTGSEPHPYDLIGLMILQLHKGLISNTVIQGIRMSTYMNFKENNTIQPITCMFNERLSTVFPFLKNIDDRSVTCTIYLPLFLSTMGTTVITTK